MPENPKMPLVIQMILNEAERPRSREAIEAGGKFVLGQITLGEYLLAQRKDRLNQ